ncbi:MAG: hypothetical protein IJT51_09795 [Bacteroidales bacterium]|nr:hypothetical protein [Bacteroidales bacterium]
MNVLKITAYISVFCLLLTSTGCKHKTEQEIFIQKLQAAITASEEAVDSVSILSVDTLSRTQYAGLILEQLENMEFECQMVYDAGHDSLPEAQLRELELTMAEIRDACDFYRDRYEKGNSENEIFIFFVDAELYKKNDVLNYFYLITPDFVVHDDPFGDNLLE